MKKETTGSRIILFVLVIFLTGNAQGQARVDSDPAAASKVDALFANWNKPDSPGAAVAIVSGTETIYRKEFGAAVLENSVPITRSTIFNAASVSKQFSAFAILLLVNQGKLSLDDNVRKHLPELPDFKRTIKVRHLLNHTSGLRDQAELAAVAGIRLDDVLTQRQVLKIIQRQRELNFDPGEEMSYCNTGYTLLAEIVARVSGKTFRQFADENIFKPLEMTNTHFHDDYVMLVTNRASSYFSIGPSRFINLPLNTAHVGAANLMTTTEDLAKWLVNFENGKVGGKAIVTQMLETGFLNNKTKTDYGGGVELKSYRGLRAVSHAGGDAGFRSFMIYFPEQEFGVAILSNLGNFVGRDIAQKIADIYLEKELMPSRGASSPAQDNETSSVQVKVNAKELNEYVGTYYSDELDTTYSIAVKDGQLVAQHLRNDDVTLTPVSRDKFSGEMWWFKSISFTRNDRRRITGFRLNTFRSVRNLSFVTK